MIRLHVHVLLERIVIAYIDDFLKSMCMYVSVQYVCSSLVPRSLPVSNVAHKKWESLGSEITCAIL